MPKKLLVGINGTPYSRAAGELAIELARQSGARLQALGIVDVPRLTSPEPVPLGATQYKEQRDAAVLQTAHAEMDRLLFEYAAACAAAKVAAYSTLKLAGDPVDVLVREVQRHDLLIVGKKHAPADEWEHATRTLDELLRRTSRPVLSVPVARSTGTPAVVAYNGSLEAARTLAAFVASGLAKGRELHVVSLGPGAAEHAGLAADYLAGHDLAASQHIEEDAPAPAERILEIARQTAAGLIVMGSHSHGRMAEFFFGSVTKTVLRESQVPLFLFH
jgi:nucleotide-binding universal stress UspA family protein